MQEIPSFITYQNKAILNKRSYLGIASSHSVLQALLLLFELRLLNFHVLNDDKHRHEI